MYRPNSIEQLRLENAQLIVENNQLRHTLYAVQDLINQAVADHDEGEQGELFTVEEVEKFFSNPEEESSSGVTNLSEMMVKGLPRLGLYLQDSKEFPTLSNSLNGSVWGIFTEEDEYEYKDDYEDDYDGDYEGEEFASPVLKKLDQSLEAVTGLFAVLRDFISDIMFSEYDEDLDDPEEDDDQW